MLLMKSNDKYIPLIIVGAPRSGTNMLRDILVSLRGIATWPCDEINYIWRHGNIRYPSDELPPSLASEPIKKFIKSRFFGISERYNAKVVVEKTCANSLRIPFVDAVLPDAKYLFIYRDGIDVIASARERWTAKLDLKYVMDKAKFIPKQDLPYYAFKYFWARIYRIFSHERRLAFWGPNLDGMHGVLKDRTLNEVCALQWERCILKAEESISRMPADKCLQIRYEEFVGQPIEELNKILQFMGYEVPADEVARAVALVSSKSVGKGRQVLEPREVSHLLSVVGETLTKFGYASTHA